MLFQHKASQAFAVYMNNKNIKYFYFEEQENKQKSPKQKTCN